MFAEGPDEIRQWIRDGVPESQRNSESWQQERDAGVVVMPAFGDKLSAEEIDDLVAYVMAVSKMAVPEEPRARRGMERAEALGCFGCHGAGGRLAQPNPGSLKGHIPSWDGDDFPELVRDRDEFAEWVEDGISKRFSESTFARGYLDRANIMMPAFRDHLESRDIDAMWAYIEWMREQGK